MPTEHSNPAQPQFWNERWERQEIGFHQSDVHAGLQRYWPELGAAGRVFVPLCGKSVDMRWLMAQGHEVVGAELSQLATDAFFREQSLPAEQDTVGPFRRYRSEGISVLQGDYFQLQPEYLRGIDAVYDRAALIALPQEAQRQYVEQLLRILPERPPILLITLEYDAGQMSGPPFSTPPERVEELYGGAYRMRVLCREDILQDHPSFRSRGLAELVEQIAVLTAR